MKQDYIQDISNWQSLYIGVVVKNKELQDRITDLEHRVDMIDHNHQMEMRRSENAFSSVSICSGPLQDQYDREEEQ